jgi:hypothetical protein
MEPPILAPLRDVKCRYGESGPDLSQLRGEADEAGREYFERLTPQQRLDIFLEVLWRGRSGNEADERLERVYRIIKLSES